jgi:hypothetical protein
MENGEIVIYQNNEGDIKLDVCLEDETVWLTQDQMAALFGKAKSAINEHIKMFLLKVNSRKKWLFGISELPLNM